MIDRNPKYDSLEGILNQAYAQAAFGKGAERHANAKAFDVQPMLEIGRMLGPAGPLFQAMKKCQEAASFVEKSKVTLHTEHNLNAAKAELLGAINYCAGAVLLIEEALVKAKGDLDVSLGILKDIRALE